jgi:hypothetical protein
MFIQELTPCRPSAGVPSRFRKPNGERTHLACPATVLQTQRRVPSDDLLSTAELESHDHAYGARPFDAVET